eukprot:m.48926 g.48926  ORF g.48926 m.48926 type:complete len:258 (-) comp13332_c0_seq2:163-936(-)
MNPQCQAFVSLIGPSRWLIVACPSPTTCSNCFAFMHHCPLSNAFKTVLPDEFHPLPDKTLMPAYIHGYFFNHRFWHPERAYLLKILEFHPAIQDYATKMYGDWLDKEFGSPTETWLEPVSLHLRYGYSGEPAANLLEDRRFPPLGFYDHVFGETFRGRNVRYLVFSDDVVRAQQFMRQQALKHDLEYAVVDEDVVVSTHIMSRCQHHVLTSSTLSFWGAYLDKQQPNGGITVLHDTFFKDHGNNMVPADYDWTVLHH